MKNVMIIDGAINCAYDIFQCEDEEFNEIFQRHGQDIQFIEDLEFTERLKKILEKTWNRPISKGKVDGIDGTLFFGMESKKEFYPNKMDSDLDFKGRAFSVERIINN